MWQQNNFRCYFMWIVINLFQLPHLMMHIFETASRVRKDFVEMCFTTLLPMCGYV